LKNRYPSLIREIRGKGFMIGCVVSVSAKKIKDLFREERVLVNATGPADDVIRILPPLSITYDETDDFLSVAEKIFSSLPVEKS
jgi:acetylornithine/succinyldiaminopimelate/putrescine aminotransferase